MTQTYSQISQSFDRFAVRYDEDVEPNPIHAHLRRRSLQWLDEAFSPGMHVFEIGCGTGTEAVHLAARGVEVTAIDISESMVRRARQRVREAGLENRAHIVQAASADIRTLVGDAALDGAYASFGALNCGPELRTVAGDLARVLKGGAVFAASVISRPCAFEMAAEVVHLNPSKAFRRLRDPAVINLAPGAPLEVHVYSEHDLREALSPGFELERLEGWLVALPPPYLVGMWNRVSALQKPFHRLDDLLSRRWPFRGWGEHIHVWARRRA